jgi:hypothetical protein
LLPLALPRAWARSSQYWVHDDDHAKVKAYIHKLAEKRKQAGKQ